MVTAAIGIICKAPKAGESKTRLIPRLGLERATALAQAFLIDLARTIDEAAATVGCACYAVCSPHSAAAELSAFLPTSFDYVVKTDPDLGRVLRDLIRNQDCIEKPTLLVVDGVGIGRAIVQELGREMPHLLAGNSFDDQNVSGLKVRRFHNSMPAMHDGLVRLPMTMPGLATLLDEFAAFPDGRNDDQVDAVCNVAANRELIIRRARLFGERLGRIRSIPRVIPPTPPKSRDQELHDRRRQYRD